MQESSKNIHYFPLPLHCVCVCVCVWIMIAQTTAEYVLKIKNSIYLNFMIDPEMSEKFMSEKSERGHQSITQ